MKHLIETTNPSGLPIVEYDRLILNSNTNDVLVRGGGYVDLGLPSGLKWAKCNVGAETETDYGDYFMWGSTTPNTASECTLTNAPFNGGTWDAWTKYCTNNKYGTVDNKTTLGPEDDAATQIMGGDWRMPTQTEWYELWDNTNNEWISNYNGTGVNGRKFTSKKNGNSIFIPAAGLYLDGSVGDVDNGSVWSSSLDTLDNSTAWRLYFGSEDFDVDTNGRDMGMVVRGVCE